jgi:hypothetical protein
VAPPKGCCPAPAVRGGVVTFTRGTHEEGARPEGPGASLAVVLVVLAALALAVAVFGLLRLLAPGPPAPVPPGPYRAASDCGTAARVVTVSDASALHDALDAARPGDVIWVEPGTYEGEFTASQPGTADRHITLCGPSSAVLRGSTLEHGYTLHLDGADYTDVRGLTVEGGLKGIMTDRWSHGTIDHVTVRDIGEEGIHLRRWSSDDTVSHCRVSHTGTGDSSDAHHNGEGLYIGSAYVHWDRYTNGSPDASDRARVIGNAFDHTTAENIDIKEGTTGGLIVGNHLDGAGMDPEAADSWVDVKGNDYTISHNVGVDAPTDGFQTHEQLPGWGEGNVFTHNVADVGADGFGFDVQGSGSNTVGCDNTVRSAASGLANIPCG